MEEISKIINEKEYRFRPLRTKRSIIFKAKLLKLIGPGLANFPAGKLGGLVDEDIKEAAIKFVGTALASASPEEVFDLIQSTVMQIVVFPDTSTETKFDEVYGENEEALLEVFAYCVEIQTGGTIAYIKKKLNLKESSTTDSLQVPVEPNQRP